jgi:signal peptidase II
MPYDGVAAITSQGYAPSMFGCVVDMFYFPIINGHFPTWFPIWGGEDFQFFSPIFNFADASISCGVIIILLFQNRFAKKRQVIESSSSEIIETNINSADLNTNQH